MKAQKNPNEDPYPPCGQHPPPDAAQDQALAQLDAQKLSLLLPMEIPL